MSKMIYFYGGVYLLFLSNFIFLLRGSSMYLISSLDVSLTF